MEQISSGFSDALAFVQSRGSLFWSLSAVAGAHAMVYPFRRAAPIPWILRIAAFYLEVRLAMELFRRQSVWMPQEFALFGCYSLSLLRGLLTVYFDDAPPRWISDRPMFDPRPFHWACSFGFLCYGLQTAQPVFESNFLLGRSTLPEASAIAGVLACRWLHFDRWDKYLWLMAPVLWGVRNLTDMDQPPFRHETDATIAALGGAFFVRAWFTSSKYVKLPGPLSLENQVPKQPLLRFAPKCNGGIQGDPSQDEYIDRDGDTANAFYIVNDKRAEQAHAEKMAAACNSPLIADNSVRPKARR